MTFGDWLGLQSDAVAVDVLLTRPEVQAVIRDLGLMLTRIIERVAAVKAPGYAPYFERLGYSPGWAHIRAGLVQHFARRHFEESRDKRLALSAFHKLAKHEQWHPRLIPHIVCLRDNIWDADFLDDALREFDCPALKEEVLDLVRRASGGDPGLGARLLAVVVRLAPQVPSPRGRLPRFETVLHQTFLRQSAWAGGRSGYTYGLVPDDADAVEDFTDEATRATRIELGRASFNPVSARRAERRRRAADLDT